VERGPPAGCRERRRNDHQREHRDQHGGDRNQRDHAGGHPDDRLDEAGQAEHHVQRLGSAGLHPLHPVVEVRRVERSEIYGGGHVENLALRPAADELAEDLLALALQRVGGELDRRDEGHRQRPREHRGQRGPSADPLEQGGEGGLSEQQQAERAEPADHEQPCRRDQVGTAGGPRDTHGVPHKPRDSAHRQPGRPLLVVELEHDHEAQCGSPSPADASDYRWDPAAATSPAALRSGRTAPAPPHCPLSCLEAAPVAPAEEAGRRWMTLADATVRAKQCGCPGALAATEPGRMY
jgi:hypothetical protein